MKTLYYQIGLLLMLSVNSYSQFSTSLEHLEIPNTPATVLLDQSISNVENPKSVKAFTSNLINTFTKDYKVPNNYAVSFTPYFLFTKNKTFAKHHGYDLAGNYNPFHSLYSSLNLSFALVNNDTLRNISFGITTSILKINGKNKNTKYGLAKQSFAAVETYRVNNYNPLTDNFNNEGTYKTMISNFDKELENFENTKYLFSIDLAAGYSQFADEQTKSGKFGRLGIWSTMNYNILLNPNKTTPQYISLYFYNRFLEDETQYDVASSDYIKNSYFDTGGKIELDFNKISFAYEYIKRTDNEEYRSIGSLKYKISNKIALNGGFGKNFEKSNNQIGFLGINWGLDFGTTLQQ
ncbi:hypothetical protein [Flavobacterium phycosphaerae]|uniref:hypothetical protein n=1 Tax=Flavobacterium phycosphaerae TaxID=2697515 RepID=UPI0013896C5F|nr:hypothetical protein [Flavobacterium phycosphaerae]